MNLNFNFIKSVCILFNKRAEFQEITYGKNQLAKVKSTKLFGLILQENVSWQEHIKSVVKREGSYSYAIKRLEKILPKKDLLNIYYAFVKSTLKMQLSFGVVHQVRKKSLFYKSKF